MSHSLLWRRIVLLTVCVYSSNHRVLYTIGISMTRTFQKSVGPSVCNVNKKAYFFIINSRIIIRISDARGWHPLQESEAIFSKIYKYFFNFRRNFRKITFLLTTSMSLAVEGYLHIRWKGLMFSTRKLNVISEKNYIETFRRSLKITYCLLILRYSW